MAGHIKNWLWLAVALAAATLAAGTSGTAAEPALSATATRQACANTTSPSPTAAKTLIYPAARAGTVRCP